MKAQSDRLYSYREAMRLTGSTPRQLQWWDEKGIVQPRHIGHKRCYQAADLLRLMIVQELRRKGVNPIFARRLKVIAADFLLIEVKPGCGHGNWETTRGRDRFTAYVSHWEHSPEAAIARMEKSPSGFHLVYVGELRAKLEQRTNGGKR
jgi:hypothetical protein